jgi:hypothetical protein
VPVGALPAVITAALMITCWVLLFLRIDSIAGWLTGFTDSWSETGRDVVEVAVGISIMVSGPFYGPLIRHVHTRWPFISAHQPAGHYIALRQRLDKKFVARASSAYPNLRTCR